VECTTSGQSPAAGPVQTAATPPSAEIKAAVDRYCVTCHNQRLKTANLTLDTLNVAAPAEQPEIWERVVAKLRARSMPPAGLARPDAATYGAMASFLENAIDRAWLASRTSGGAVPSIDSIASSTTTRSGICSRSTSM
jgi:hypothetical protein